MFFLHIISLFRCSALCERRDTPRTGPQSFAGRLVDEQPVTSFCAQKGHDWVYDLWSSNYSAWHFTEFPHVKCWPHSEFRCFNTTACSSKCFTELLELTSASRWGKFKMWSFQNRLLILCLKWHRLWFAFPVLCFQRTVMAAVLNQLEF